MKRSLSYVLLIFCFWSCGDENKNSTLFRKVSRADHGIDFMNNITESDSLNILTLEYIYNGGGVAVADFNNDGLSDIFFTGNMVANKLYINKGDLRFEDVSESAGISAPEKWKSGVAVADVNGDGLKDIYVCATIKPDSALRENMLFINQGINDKGIPVFHDEAAAYKVNYAGHSSGAAFLDYDNDNDLDLYVLTNTIAKGIPTSYRPKINDGTLNSDILYRNNGNGTFTDVSAEAGILHEGYGLGLAISDLNDDGWQDIYVSNDYITNDLMYINNRDGTFVNAIDDAIKHQSQFSMGNDIADFNNDALPDIITLDMLPEGNLRRKTVINGSNYSSYINNEKYGYSPQYVRNVLQLNNGDGTFSEIGQLAGVHQTEWSWSPLFADIDNDGWKDLLVTNGFPRDITDKDFGNFRAETSTIASIGYQIDSIPVVKIANYAFRNNGDLTFSDMTSEWGMSHRSFSNGASFADLDNDGDLDYIVNNINDEVLLYENTLYTKAGQEQDKHYLRIKLIGKEKNTGSLGAKIKLRYGNGQLQYHDHSVYRGYISSVEDIVHFGLDRVTVVDTVEVAWPDGQTSLLTNVQADQVLNVSYKNARLIKNQKKSADKQLLLKDAAERSRISYRHQEEDHIDFNIQRTIPHKFSQSGPGLAVGDVNDDRLEDLYVGASAGQDGAIFLQQADGSFKKKLLQKSGHSGAEDQGALFFDADKDRDLDLFVVSGTFEYPPDSPEHQDRLYLNDGAGNFKHEPSALPNTTSSGSCVRAADFDADGDLDLFVGGRVVPGKYPLPAESYLLINDKGKFTNGTSDWCPELSRVGMVTDAVWSDFNNDQTVDLVVAGEFMPITLYENKGNALVKVKESGLENLSGWWNSLAASDFDRDGDIDYVAGNLGRNNFYKASNKTPLRVYASDFDGNNSVDAILSCYLLSEDGVQKEFPVHFWDELNSQSPKFRRKFQYYKQYGRATLDKLLTTEERKDALILETNYTSTSYLQNVGGGKFKVTALPMRAQIAPVNGILVDDINADGFTDILMVGNDYGNEVFTGRHDALTGITLLNDRRGGFDIRTPAQTGFFVHGDAKALVRIASRQGDLYVASQNRDSLKIFESLMPLKRNRFFPEILDVRAEYTLDSGRKETVEFYYGSGYLSQSSRSVIIPHGVNEMIIYNSRGESRKMSLTDM